MFGRIVVGLVNMAVDPPRFPTPPPETSIGGSRITCDQCRSVVRGIRYKCLNCPNFDLCESCVDHYKGKFVHAANFDDKHLFRAIAPIGSNNATSNRAIGHSREQAGGSITAFSCDMCTQAITGVRHHCLNCVDFDTCSACFQNSRDDHFFLHAFEERVEQGVRGPRGSGRRGKCKAIEAPFQGSDHPTTALSVNSRETVPGPQPFLQTTQKGANSSVGDEHQIAGSARISSPPPIEQRISQRLHPAALEDPMKTFEGPTLDSQPQSMSRPLSTKPPSAARSVPTRPTPFASRPSPSISACFVSSNTVPDQHLILAGAYFQKSWRLKNNGSVSWPAGTSLVYVEGDRLGAFDSRYNVPQGVYPGELVDVTVLFQAPDVPGSYVSSWKLTHGEFFGDLLRCDIVTKPRDPNFL